jgi:hypothetical protein
MRLYDEGQHPSHDAGEQTIPMEVIPGPIPAALSSPRRPRLPFLQSLYYLVATLVLLGGTLGGLAMYFGWWGLDHLFDGGVQRGLPVQTLITPTPGTPATTATWLAQDAFARPDQPLWGRASDGMVWGGDANSSAAFAIQGGAGTITGGAGFFTALLGPGEATTEVEVSASLSHFDGGRDNVGAVLRFTDDGNYYKAFIDGAQLVVMKRVAGVGVTLAAVPFSARDGVAYSIRFQARGTQLLARAWLSGATEPGGWMVAATDGSLARGLGGLRALLEHGILARVFAFGERTVAGVS